MGAEHAGFVTVLVPLRTFVRYALAAVRSAKPLHYFVSNSALLADFRRVLTLPRISCPQSCRVGWAHAEFSLLPTNSAWSRLSSWGFG